MLEWFFKGFEVGASLVSALAGLFLAMGIAYTVVCAVAMIGGETISRVLNWWGRR